MERHSLRMQHHNAEILRTLLLTAVFFFVVQ